MPWFFAVAERDHELQNPTSPEKIRRLGEILRLDGDSHVLDVACGKGGPAVILAGEFGCRITAVERAPEFVEAARRRVAAAGLGDRVEIVARDAREFPLEPERYDAALCLGASFVWDDLAGTLAALTPTARRGGHVVVGEPFWRQWPLPDSVDDGGFLPLPRTVDCFASAGLTLVALIASSTDDWDHYESLHWRAVEEWLAANGDDPDADEIRRRHEHARASYLAHSRHLFGWAIFVAKKI